MSGEIPTEGARRHADESATAWQHCQGGAATHRPAGTAYRRPVARIPDTKLYGDGDIQLRVVAHVLQFMEERGISQNEVAERAGLRSGRMSRYMTGQRGTSFGSIGLILRIANALETTPSKILREPPGAQFYDQAKLKRGEAP